jgi:hypothetical protein
LVTDLMLTVVELLDRHVETLPVRAVARQRENPLVLAFVRQLAWHFQTQFGERSPATLARIANAVLDDIPRDEPLDERRVERILRGCTPPKRSHGAR